MAQFTGMARSRVRFGANCNVVLDGNSIVEGAGTTPGFSFSSQLIDLAPIKGSSVHTLGISGQTWRMMDGLDGQSSHDVDYYFDPARTNVLIAWETTNSVTSGRTGIQAVEDAAKYIGHRKALHPEWIVVVMATIPRALGDNRVYELIKADNELRRNWRDIGIDLFFDTRRLVPEFNFVGDNPAHYQAIQHLLYEQGSDWVHPNNEGCRIIANRVASALRSLPPKPRFSQRVWVDDVAPLYIRSGIYDWAKNRISIELSKSLRPSSKVLPSAFSVSASGGAATIASVIVDGSSVLLDLSRNIAHGETVSWSYTKPAATLVGPGAGMAGTRSTDSGDRMNVDTASKITLPAGRHRVDSFTFDNGSTSGVVTPFLAKLTGSGPRAYEVLWLGAPIDAGARGLPLGAHTESYQDAFIELAGATDVYVGFSTLSGGSVRFVFDVGVSDHDDTYTPPAHVGDAITGIHYEFLGRSYAMHAALRMAVRDMHDNEFASKTSTTANNNVT